MHPSPPSGSSGSAPEPIAERRTGRSSGWVAFAAGAAALCAAYAILRLPGATLDHLVQEDGPVEWAGAIGMTIGTGLLLVSFVIVRRDPARYGVALLGAWFLLLFAIVLLVFDGEEISWGQRLLGIGTPESFSSINAQHETTLHNINVFQGTTLDGDRLFRIGWVAFFVLLPVAALLSTWVRQTRERLLPVVVPLWLAGLFVAAWVLGWVATHTLQDGYSSAYAIGSAATEIQEAAVELLMGVAGLLTFLHVRRTQQRTASSGPASSSCEPEHRSGRSGVSARPPARLTPAAAAPRASICPPRASRSAGAA